MERPSFESVAKRTKPKTLSPAVPQPLPPTADPVPSDNALIVESVQFAAVSSVTPNAFYTITTKDKSLLCANDSGSGDSYQWAFLGTSSYLNNSVQVMFDADPTTTPATMTLLYQGDKKYLFANGDATSWEYCFFGTSAYESSYPKLKLSAVATGSGTFKLKWKNGNTDMYLCPTSAGSSWEYLFVGSDGYTPAEFNVTRSYLTAKSAIKAFKSEWPDSFNINEFKNLDANYDLIPDSIAQTIYTDSGLKNYQYKSEIFDCDDFAWVYKAQVSKYIYNTNNTYPFALIFLAAVSPSAGHAVNAYINGQGKIIVLEPQNGSTVNGKDWKDQQGNYYTPIWAVL